MTDFFAFAGKSSSAIGLPTWLFPSAMVGLAGCLALGIPWSDFAQAGSVFYFVPLMILATVFSSLAIRFLPETSARHQAQVFWGVAIALRLLVLPMTPGDDIYRYLWEGRIQHFGFNPYLLAPNAPELTHLRDAWWPMINHKGWAAIYPPGVQLILKGLTVFGPSILLIKIVCLLADLLTIFFLQKLCRAFSMGKQAFWYAWNPLVIYAFAGSGHFDSLMLAPLLGAIVAMEKAVVLPKNWMWSGIAALLLGIAVSIKIVPLIVVPVFMIALRRRLLVLPLVALPIGLAALVYGFPEEAIFKHLGEFGRVTRFNDLVWWISERWIWSNPTQKNGTYTVLATVFTFLASTVAFWNWRKAMLCVFGTAIVFSTVLHPWYLTWLLPFAAWQRARPWFVFSATIFLAFLWWETTPWWEAWKPSPLLSLAITFPVLVAWLLAAGRRWFWSKATPAPTRLPQNPAV